MEASYGALAESLAGTHVRVAKFRADTARDFASETFGLRTFPTIVMLPKAKPGHITYPSERRDADTLGMWVSAVAGYE
jgi:adenylyl-sulfate reductase (glutathione)